MSTPKRKRPAVPALLVLKAWLKEKGLTQEELAQKLGLSQASTWQWLKDGSRPKHHHRNALEILTNGAVKANDWLNAEERRSVESVRKDAA